MNWYTSDPHFGHRAIISMNNRPFRDVDEMNNTIINNFNSVVMPTDNLFILGDCSLHISLEETVALLDRIRCKNKYLIRGNHDKNFPEGFFKGVYDYLEVQDHDQWFVLEHYPLKTFKHQARSWIHLHGHQHNPPEYNLMNKKVIDDIENEGQVIIAGNDLGPDSAEIPEQNETAEQDALALC